jgi:uncharacterized protein YjhX (UPF0386 family)
MSNNRRGLKGGRSSSSKNKQKIILEVIKKKDRTTHTSGKIGRLKAETEVPQDILRVEGPNRGGNIHAKPAISLLRASVYQIKRS